MGMKANWWKWLGIGLMFYVLFAGMLIPLKPGIVAVDQQQVSAGEVQILKVETYNTRYESGDDLRAWLRLGRPASAEDVVDTALTASSVKVLSSQELELTFSIPADLPGSQTSAFASLIIDSPRDGAFVIPQSLAIVQKGSDTGEASAWNDPIASLHSAEGMSFPFRGLLGETIRNQYFHVSLWFALMLIMLGAAVQAGLFLRTGNMQHHLKSESLTRVGLLFGVLGLSTGMIWANYTWGKPWSGDVKQNMTAVALLIYLAYFILKSSISSEQMAARVAAAYNLFAFAMLIPLLYIIPRMRESLHPGAGGNPGFGGEDLDHTMRMVFYPGVIGFALIGLWLAQLWWRYSTLKRLEEMR